MSETTDRFVFEIGSGTVAHVIDTDADQAETDSRFSLSPSAPGEKMCSRGYRHHTDQRVSFTDFVKCHYIYKRDFKGDAPGKICSYCWSNTREAVEKDQERNTEDVSKKAGTVGYRLRWKQKGHARDEWYEIVVSGLTTMAELDRLVCWFSTLDDYHLRMYGLEDEYLNSSLNVLPDHQYEKTGDRSYTKASEMTVADVAKRAGLCEGDRLSLVYDFGTPLHYYCIVKDVYDPDELTEILDGSNVIKSTDTAAIVREKRP